MRIGLDVDGVLSNFSHGYREALASAARRPNEVPYDLEPDSWDFEASLGYTTDHKREAWKIIHSDRYFWSTLSPYAGTTTFLDWLWHTVAEANWLAGTAHEVYFLTSRSGIAAKDQTELWLKRHGFSGLAPTVLVCRGEKGRIAADLHLTHFLDDKPGNCESVRSHTEKCHIYALARKWNESAQPSLRERGITVLSSLESFQHILALEL